MTNFTKSLCKISIPVTLQCMLGMLFVGLIMSSRYGAKVRAFKQRIFMKTICSCSVNWNLTEQRYKPYEYLYVNIHKAFSLISLSTS